DEQPGSGVQAEREPDRQAVEKAVRRQAGGPERADARVRPRLLRLVTVVEDEQALGEEEREEARADERRHPTRVADRVDRLRQHVEERDRDDDPAAERDQRVDPAAEPERERAAEER